MYLCERETTCLKNSQTTLYITWSEDYMGKISPAGGIFLKYLFLIVHYLIPSLVRLVLIFPGSYLFFWIYNLENNVLKIVVFLLILSLSSALLMSISAGVLKLGEFSMKNSPSRFWFWVVFVINCVIFVVLFFKPDYALVIWDLDGNVIAYLPKVIDIIVTAGILFVYGLGGKAYNKEEVVYKKKKKTSGADSLFPELDEEDELAKHIPEGVDLSDPEVKEFWKGIQKMRDRGHYSFVHYLLRDLALEHSDTFSKMIVKAHKVPKDNPFIDLWLENGGLEDDLEKDTFKPRFRSLPGGDFLIIMKMPKVVLPNEAEYIGINLKTKDKLSFYTFELTREGKYVLCKWMKENNHNKPAHYLLSKAYDNSSVDIFYDGILKLTV